MSASAVRTNGFCLPAVAAGGTSSSASAAAAPPNDTLNRFTTLMYAEDRQARPEPLLRGHSGTLAQARVYNLVAMFSWLGTGRRVAPLAVALLCVFLLAACGGGASKPQRV